MFMSVIGNDPLSKSSLRYSDTGGNTYVLIMPCIWRHLLQRYHQFSKRNFSSTGTTSTVIVIDGNDNRINTGVIYIFIYLFMRILFIIIVFMNLICVLVCTYVHTFLQNLSHSPSAWEVLEWKMTTYRDGSCR